MLVGRSAEVAVLSTALDRTLGGAPTFVALNGEPGIGKTSLLRHLADLATARGCLTLEGRAAEFQGDMPFGLVIDALDAFLASLDPQIVQRLAADRLGALAAVFPALGSLGGATDHPVSAVERFRIHAAIGELLDRLASRTPLVMVLDDLHWADEATLEVLSYLVRHPPRAEVMIALAFRRGHGTPAVDLAIGAIERALDGVSIELAPLSRDALSDMIQGLDDGEIERLHLLSGGNPFFALELVGTASARPGDATSLDQVPPAVIRAIDAELATLDPRWRELVHTIGVLGDPFDVDLACEVAGLPEDELFDGIDALVQQDLIRPTGVPRRFQFRHPVVRSAVYGSARPSVKVTCHRRAATALLVRGATPGVIAGHMEQAAAIGDQEAIDVLRKAGESASQSAPASAVRWFVAALRLLPGGAPTSDRISLLTSLATTQASMGRLSDANDALTECLELVPIGAVGHVDLLVAWSGLEQVLGRYAQVQSRLESTLDVLGENDAKGRTAVLVALTEVGFYLADQDAMNRYAEQAFEAASETGDDVLLAAALAAAAIGAAFAGDLQLAAIRRSRAIDLIDQMPDHAVSERLDALANLSAAELYMDLYGPSRDHASRGLELARRTSQAHLVPKFNPSLGTSLWMLGDMPRSAEVLDDAIEGARLTSDDQAIAWNLFNRSLQAVMVGDIALALTLGEESFRLSESFEPGLISAYAGAVLASALVEDGEPARAIEVLVGRTGGEGIPRIAGGWRAIFLELLVRCLLELDDLEGARTAAALARVQAQSTMLTLPLIAAERSAALVALAERRAGDAIDHATRAAGHALELGARVHLATSWALIGTGLEAAGRPEQAVTHYERAAAEFDSLGATRYRNEVESRLRTLGRTVHRRSSRGDPSGIGIAALTGRELEVANLIVDRLTNREIAASLFLSTKTVESHVRNIFNKIGATSRVEVARMLTADRDVRGVTPQT